MVYVVKSEVWDVEKDLKIANEFVAKVAGSLGIEAPKVVQGFLNRYLLDKPYYRGMYHKKSNRIIIAADWPWRDREDVIKNITHEISEWLLSVLGKDMPRWVVAHSEDKLYKKLARIVRKYFPSDAESVVEKGLTCLTNIFKKN